MPIKVAGQELKEKQVANIIGFIALFLVCFVLFSAIMSFLIDDFTTALNINPSLELYEMRSGSYLKSGSNVLALADGLHIINMASHNAESYYVSMEALERLGFRTKKAAFKVAHISSFKYI